jgi:TM2 domain-containing membrane protein YozV
MNQSLIRKTHKNNTLATLLASVLGGLGIHRFYLYGITDKWGWAHAASLLFSSGILMTAPSIPFFFGISPLMLSALIAFIEALVIGLTPDEKWDAAHNQGSGKQTHSAWPLALLLILTVGIGATALIAAIARTFDLLYTGGAFG